MLKLTRNLAIYLLTLGASLGVANAQLNQNKFEVGGVFTAITLNDFTTVPSPTTGVKDTTVRGIGGRLGYNFNNYVALDAEGSFFPEAHLSNDAVGQKLQGLIGVKAGARTKHVGLFAKARPGVMWFGDFPASGSCSTTSFGSVCGASHEHDFALDLGGVVEFYPAKRAIIRVDVGDTLIEFREHRFGIGSTTTVVTGKLRSNFQLSLGFGWRF